ncbi:MAG: F0F1 ATP synthase subunit A [Rhodothermales bacterium]|nr:F0F1 ATP synthase subunit A [Rhodothermales bacterium]
MRLLSRNLFVILTIASWFAIRADAASLNDTNVFDVVFQEAAEHVADQDAEDHSAQDASNEHGETEDEHAEVEELDPVHHNSDAFYLDFEPFGKVQLPRIFLVERADGSTGVDFYGSTDAAVTAGYIAHIEEGSHYGVLDAVLEPSTGHIIVDFSITKHLVFAWLGAIIVLLIFISVARMYQRGIGRDSAPKGIFQNMMESLILFVRDDIARPILHDKADKYLPYLLTAFFFILTCNLLGLVPFGATATSNLMVTAVLATFTFVITQLGGTKDYWLHIFWPPGAPVFVKIILMPVEILGMFTKPFALAVRLFANMTAGHLVILSLIGLIFAFTNLFGTAAGYGVAPISVAFALFIFLLEILVASIQAYVFTMLSALFIGMAVEEHGHEDHEAEQAGTAHGQDDEHASAQLEPAVAS